MGVRSGSERCRMSVGVAAAVCVVAWVAWVSRLGSDLAVSTRIGLWVRDDESMKSV